MALSFYTRKNKHRVEVSSIMFHENFCTCIYLYLCLNVFVLDLPLHGNYGTFFAFIIIRKGPQDSVNHIHGELSSAPANS